jgi:phage/plasmid-like protein (TIGR03299 family)
VAEALQIAGLDWSVDDRPLSVAGRAHEIDRVALVREDTGAVLGLVSGRYAVVQNREAFGVLDELIAKDVYLVAAGAFGGGREVWVLARLAGDLQVGGDQVERLLLATNSHHGRAAISLSAVPLRSLCQNLLIWEVGVSRTITFRHVRHDIKLLSARRVESFVQRYFQEFRVRGDELASERMDLRAFQRFAARSLGVSGSDLDDVVELFESGETVGDAGGSTWTAVNTVQEHVDWRSGRRGFRGMLSDPGGIKARALAAIAS